MQSQWLVADIISGPHIYVNQNLSIYRLFGYGWKWLKVVEMWSREENSKNRENIEKEAKMQNMTNQGDFFCQDKNGVQ